MRDLSWKDKEFFVDEHLLARGYTRLVVGGRGAYIEFPPDLIDEDLLEPEPNEEYRLLPEWYSKVFYAWLRTKYGHKKVYFQYKTVDYADYLPGYYYIFVNDVNFDGDLYEEILKDLD